MLFKSFKYRQLSFYTSVMFLKYVVHIKHIIPLENSVYLGG